MKFCLLEDNVHSIHIYAFNLCVSMEACKLSIDLSNTDSGAFSSYAFLEGMFFPSNEILITGWVFKNCSNIRILDLHHDITIANGDKYLMDVISYLVT